MNFCQHRIVLSLNKLAAHTCIAHIREYYPQVPNTILSVCEVFDKNSMSYIIGTRALPILPVFLQ